MSISYQAPEPKTLAQFFSRVGEALTQPATLRFRGGSAIRWLGSDLLTNDFDYDLTATDTAEVRAVMGRIAKEMRLDIEDWIFDEPAALPPVQRHIYDRLRDQDVADDPPKDHYFAGSQLAIAAMIRRVLRRG